MEDRKRHSYLQEMQERIASQLQASQPHLSPWEDDKNPCGNISKYMKDKKSDWE